MLKSLLPLLGAGAGGRRAPEETGGSGEEGGGARPQGEGDAGAECLGRWALNFGPYTHADAHTHTHTRLTELALVWTQGPMHRLSSMIVERTHHYIHWAATNNNFHIRLILLYFFD